MTWVKLEDTFFSHPKVIAAGDEAACLWIKALCWSRQHLTDGRIPLDVVSHQFGPNASELAEKLVENGLWKSGRLGYSIVNYAKHNQTKAQVEGAREADRERKRVLRGTRKDSARIPVTEKSRVDKNSPLPPKTDCVRCQGDGEYWHPGPGAMAPCECTIELRAVQ